MSKLKTKTFDLADVLSITDGMLLSKRHMGGVYDILNFMTGDDLFTHQLPRAADECRPHILRQVPVLDSEGVKADLASLRHILNEEGQKPAPDLRGVIDRVVGRMALRYGDSFTLQQMPAAAHEVRSPIDEAREILGNKLIVIT